MFLPGDLLFEEAEALTTEALTSDAVFPEPQGGNCICLTVRTHIDIRSCMVIITILHADNT